VKGNTDKLLILKDILKECRGAVLSFSGGVDSTFLARVARDVLGGRLLAVTAFSAIHPQRELKEAQTIAQQLGLKHLVIASEELSNEKFVANSPDRCYHCKKEMFGIFQDIAREHGFPWVLDGSNFDDQFDHRPGIQAGDELGIISPLKEAGLTKENIRELSREMGLPTWDKPSFACLASRFPYGERITEEKLSMVEEAEDYLCSLGINIFRVRHHGDLARIEVPRKDFLHIMERSADIDKRLCTIGYRYVALDLKGFRSGSMNEVLKK
jgi:uncharacterized protein